MEVSSANAEKILKIIGERPATRVAIAKAYGVKPVTMRNYLFQMRTRGLIDYDDATNTWSAKAATEETPMAPEAKGGAELATKDDIEKLLSAIESGAATGETAAAAAKEAATAHGKLCEAGKCSEMVTVKDEGGDDRQVGACDAARSQVRAELLHEIEHGVRWAGEEDAAVRVNGAVKRWFEAGRPAEGVETDELLGV